MYKVTKTLFVLCQSINQSIILLFNMAYGTNSNK